MDEQDEHKQEHDGRELGEYPLGTRAYAFGGGYWRYRPCELTWIEEILLYAKRADISVFTKQLGTHLAKELKLRDSHGANIEEWPESIQVQEFPPQILKWRERYAKNGNDNEPQDVRRKAESGSLSVLPRFA